MSTALKVLIRVIRRRMEAGELFEKILLNYPKIDPEKELPILKKELGIDV